jgi:hypothetical protein
MREMQAIEALKSEKADKEVIGISEMPFDCALTGGIPLYSGNCNS